MTKPRFQMLHFSLLFSEHQYLANSQGLTSKIFKTQRIHSDLVNHVSDFLYRT